MTTFSDNFGHFTLRRHTLPGTLMLDVGFNAIWAMIGWPDEIPTEHTARMVRFKAFEVTLSHDLSEPFLSHYATKTITNLNAFDGIDAHQRVGNISIQSIKYWLT